MPIQHIFLALLVAALWGFNFVTVKIGLTEIPVFLFCALRFIISLLPVFFIPRPSVSWSLLSGIAISQGILKFSCMFIGLYLGMSAGLASLVLQTQVFFTLLLCAFFYNQRISLHSFMGILLAFSGIVLIGIDSGQETTFSGFMLTLAAAFFWSVSSLFQQRVGNADPLAVVVWSSLIPPIPLLVASFVIEGASTPFVVIPNLSLLAWSTVLFAAIGATWIGASIWLHLLRTHGAASVAPYSLLIPVFGILSGVVVLGERLSWLSSSACVLIFMGLAIHYLSNKLPSQQEFDVERRKAA